MKRDRKMNASTRIIALICAISVASQPLTAFNLNLPTWITNRLYSVKPIINTALKPLAKAPHCLTNFFVATVAKIRESYQEASIQTAAIVIGIVIFGAYLWDRPEPSSYSSMKMQNQSENNEEENKNEEDAIKPSKEMLNLMQTLKERESIFSKNLNENENKNEQKSELTTLKI